MREMARAEWASYHSNNGSGSFGRGKWCSYKRTTLVVCSINIVVALFVLRSLYNSLYMYPYNDLTAFRYTSDQIRKMEESIRIRRESEPTELVKLVEKLKKEFLREERAIEVPRSLKLRITDELLIRLRALNASSNSTMQRADVVEDWRKLKLSELRLVIRRNITNSTILPEEAGVLERALGPGWAEFSEEIGLWIPFEVTHKEHDDKPEGIEEFDREILPGQRLPPECHAELHTDYDGTAVRWGLTHPKESAYECCMACLDHAKNAKPNEKKCNIWVYCPSETGCFSPDIYEHKNQECWLKYAENPKLNFKDRYSESYRSAHPNAPLIVPWVSGVVSV